MVWSVNFLTILSCLATGSYAFFGFQIPISRLPKLPALLPGIFRSEVCYVELGCFSIRGNFQNLLLRPLQLLPQSPKSIRPTYALYTRKNILSAQYIRYNEKKSVSTSNYNPSLPTKIIIHGFLDRGTVAWMTEMKKAFLERGDYNVIQLDWSKGNGFPYTQATANTRVIGALIAQMIKWLESEFQASREDFHLLGHSLGSHIAGYAGERLRDSGRQLGRITGMDPAGPYFENTHPDVRLDPTDAKFVDAIHTDGDSLLSSFILQGGFGMMQPVGHVDFYPNGGRRQPRCDDNPAVKIAVNGIIKGTKWIVSCDHLRVMPMVTSTILNFQGNYKAFPCDSYKKFKAGKCNDCGAVGCAQMGIRADEWDPRGRTNVKMFLTTTDNAPFQSTSPR